MFRRIDGSPLLMPQTHDHRGNIFAFGYNPADIDPDVFEKIKYYRAAADALALKAGLTVSLYYPVTHPSDAFFQKRNRTFQWTEKEYDGQPRRHTCRVVRGETISAETLASDLSDYPEAAAFAASLSVPYRRVKAIHVNAEFIPFMEGYNAERRDAFRAFLGK